MDEANDKNCNVTIWCCTNNCEMLASYCISYDNNSGGENQKVLNISNNIETQESAGESLGHLVTNAAQFIIPKIIPIVVNDLKTSKSGIVRQGVCLGLSKVLDKSSTRFLDKYKDTLIDSIHGALCDKVPKVRQAFVTIIKVHLRVRKKKNPIHQQMVHQFSKNSAPSPTTKTNILLVGFILFGILFCKCVFDNDLCENDILKNGIECEFKNVNDCEYAELSNGLCCPTPERIETSLQQSNSNSSRIILREKLDLGYIFGVNCKNIIYENENDYDCGDFFNGQSYYPTLYPTPFSISAPNPIIFNLIIVILNYVRILCYMVYLVLFYVNMNLSLMKQIYLTMDLWQIFMTVDIIINPLIYH